MAHAYTPGLKVLHETKVQKERQLPMKGDVLAEINAQVTPSDVVASTHIPGNVRMVNVANFLNVEAGDVPGYMTEEIGAEVKEGDMLAETGGLFGFFKSSVNSPVAGTVESVSSVTGQVVKSDQVDSLILENCQSPSNLAVIHMLTSRWRRRSAIYFFDGCNM